MKKLTKSIFSLAVVAAFAASSTAALAANELTGHITYADGKISITDDANTRGTTIDQTILVLSEDVTDVSALEADTSVIKQADQKTGAFVSDIPVGELAPGTYFVRIGGGSDTPGFISGSFTVSNGGEDPNPPTPGETEEIIIGDVNGKDGVTSNDALNILRYDVSYDEETETGTAPSGTRVGEVVTISGTSTTHIIGDVNSKDGVTSNDALNVLRYDVSYDEETETGTAPAGTRVGEKITIVKAAAE